MTEQQGHENDVLLEKIQELLEVVRLYCDSVQVIATKYNKETGESVIFDSGVGCIFQRKGAAKAWIDGDTVDYTDIDIEFDDDDSEDDDLED